MSKESLIQYAFLIFVCIVIALVIIKSKKQDFKIEVNKLIDALGGRDNIIDYEFYKSRFVVTLKDMSLVNKESIQKMGAQGMVEIDNQLKIILGNNANQLKKQINDLK